MMETVIEVFHLVTQVGIFGMFALLVLWIGPREMRSFREHARDLAGDLRRDFKDRSDLIRSEILSLNDAIGRNSLLLSEMIHAMSQKPPN
jgi:hypothetical protein